MAFYQSHSTANEVDQERVWRVWRWEPLCSFNAQSTPLPNTQAPPLWAPHLWLTPSLQGK